MPPRPSQNLDRALLDAGLALFPRRGCAGLAIREVAEAAGVNLGMFHYHFKSRDVFLRAVLQAMYERMFDQLAFEGARAGEPLANLRSALRFMGRFVRANRPVIARVFADVLSGEPVARAFARDNMPRHIGVVHALVAEAQKAGLLKPLPTPQVLGMLAGSLAFPILVGGGVVEAGVLGEAGGRELAQALLTDEAIDQRIDLALAALAAEPTVRAKAARTPTRKTPRKNTRKKSP